MKEKKLAQNEKVSQTDQKKATEVKPKTEVKVRAESMEKMAERLLKEKASEAVINAAFAKAYQAKGKKVSDEFLGKRIKIYLDIARKRTLKVTK